MTDDTRDSVNPRTGLPALPYGYYYRVRLRRAYNSSRSCFAVGLYRRWRPFFAVDHAWILDRGSGTFFSGDGRVDTAAKLTEPEIFRAAQTLHTRLERTLQTRALARAKRHLIGRYPPKRLRENS